MAKPQSKGKTVKAWAVFTPLDMRIDDADHLVDSECCCSSGGNALAIYKHKRTAYEMSSWYRAAHKYEVRPVTIIIPPSKRRKQKTK